MRIVESRERAVAKILETIRYYERCLERARNQLLQAQAFLEQEKNRPRKYRQNLRH